MSKVRIELNGGEIRALMNDAGVTNYCKSLAQERSGGEKVDIRHGKTRVNASYKKRQSHRDVLENRTFKSLFRKEHR